MTQKDLFLFTIILAAVPVAVYLVIWNPLFTGSGYDFYNPATPSTSINAYRGQYAGYDSAFQDANSLVVKYKKLAESYKSVDRTIFETIKKSIPDDIDKLSFVSEVTSLIQKEGVDPGNITVAPGPDLNGVRTMTFNFTVKGSYETMKNLMRSFEQNARFMSVRSITLTTPDTPGDPYIIVASVDAYKLR
jgi:Tfp pilus assembly protein PilO